MPSVLSDKSAGRRFAPTLLTYQENRIKESIMRARRVHSCLTATTLLALGTVGTALAHHGTANFDTTQKIELEGTITRYEWANPHVFIWLETRDEQGKAVTWQVEGGPPALLRRAGVTRDLISVGQHVKVIGHPARAPDRHEALMDSLETDANEKVAFGQADATSRIISKREDVIVASSSLQGTWAPLLDMGVFGKLSVRQLKLTDKGRQAVASYAENKSDYGKCIDGTTPGSMLAPDIKQIVLGDATITIGREWDGVIRAVHMDQRSHEGAEPSLQGHSIGRWEGDTLVVDTARFTPDPAGISMRVPSGPGKHLVERLKLDADKTHLLYSFVLEDPEYLVEPVVSGDVAWTYRPDLEFAPVACDPEIARLTAQ
jgi:hypothetical protein